MKEMPLTKPIGWFGRGGRNGVHSPFDLCLSSFSFPYTSPFPPITPPFPVPLPHSRPDEGRHGIPRSSSLPLPPPIHPPTPPLPHFRAAGARPAVHGVGRQPQLPGVWGGAPEPVRSEGWGRRRGGEEGTFVPEHGWMLPPVSTKPFVQTLTKRNAPWVPFPKFFFRLRWALRIGGG